MATAKPDAVLFMATEIAAASRLAFSAGFAVATALKAPIRPVMVPSKPINRPTLASDDKIVSALLDSRNDLEQALVHGLFDVIAAAGAGDAGHAVVQDRGDRRLGVLA